MNEIQIIDAGNMMDIMRSKRHPWIHLGKWSTITDRFHILHPQDCIDSGIDLRECEFSKAISNSAGEPFFPDVTMRMFVIDGKLSYWGHHLADEAPPYDGGPAPKD